MLKFVKIKIFSNVHIEEMKQDPLYEGLNPEYQLIAGLSGEMLVFSMLVDVVGDTKDKEDHSFWDTLLMVHFFWVWEFW